MTAISKCKKKNDTISELVKEYNNTILRTTNMKPVNVKPNTCINLSNPNST